MNQLLLLERVQEVLDREGPVLRLQNLFGVMQSQHDYSHTKETFSSNLRRGIENRESTSLHYGGRGYFALNEEAYEEWKEQQESERKSIPRSVQLKLWIASGGYCEFRGCDEYLYRDELTLHEYKHSNIAHIVAASPNGPRGDEERSGELFDKFENLMLLCQKHHSLIDDPELVDEFPEEELYEQKAEHEARIKRLTRLQSNPKTHLLFFRSDIGGQDVSWDSIDAQEVVSPRYPEERKLEIDLRNLPSGESDDDYWVHACTWLDDQFERQLNVPSGEPSIAHISVFALAPIPLLVRLGMLLGDKREVELYQHHREREPSRWRWYEDADYPGQECYVERPDDLREDDDDAKRVGLLLSLSASVDREAVSAVLEDGAPLYEVTVSTPSRAWLKTSERLASFRTEYTDVVDEIERKHGKNIELHIFPAVPAPVAIECGRCLNAKVRPQIYLYDYLGPDDGYGNPCKMPP